MQQQAYTLRQLNLLVRDAIETSLNDEYWVQAELAECRESRGHCYMELIEKDELGNTPVARASAKCWKTSWSLIRPHFEHVTGQPLRAGLKVMLRVYAQFHEAFGFSWIVTDIDPTYTVGDLARRRQEIIARLKAEGVFDMNRELSMPLFPQRIAIISSATAAGYGDFCRQLEENTYGFQFSTRLFPAIMQGEQVEQSLIAALNAIYDSLSAFPADVVVIIRGGGATADLSGFDTLALAENVAQFPVPVITGIGHDRDESILDMVAHTHVKTPTAAATLLIEQLARTLRRIDEAQARLTLALHRVTDARHRIEMLQSRMSVAIDRRLTAQRHRLENLGIQLRSHDPQLLLARGYSITLLNGHALRDPAQLRPGDEIETRIEKGSFKSIVK